MPRPALAAVLLLCHTPAVQPAPPPALDLTRARAHWVRRDILVWPLGGTEGVSGFALHHAATGGLVAGENGVQGGGSVPLSLETSGLPADLRARFPHLAGPGHAVLRLHGPLAARAGELLRGQVALSAHDAKGRVLAATGVQIPGVVDDIFIEEGPLGVSGAMGGSPTLRVWAPTARRVRLHLFGKAPSDTAALIVDMARDDASGTWSATIERRWWNRSYLYEVDVFVPATGRVETNFVTDPYSVALERNSVRSQIVDLEAARWMPAGWAQLAKPGLEAWNDIVLYELHVRDFSASDPLVPEHFRGTFSAFALQDSLGLRHLSALAAAGLTHVHLLPAFDFATVDEDRSRWASPAGDLHAFPPDSAEPQAAVMAVADRDGFNWGYDPLHYTVPEGSYAVDPDGGARVREFRSMVAALAARGLRVVMDVVYNHTTASGQSPRSVLDRVVPGYYHRLDEEGRVHKSTCCENTATEHRMMRRVMVDSVRTWARAYKVDGFRFDLMGHHMKADMLAVREALDALTLARDGVDGRAVFLYGEGWDLGEVAGGARGENATQRRMAGTGIATFNDRLRDAVRGGGAFGPPQAQGFATGLFDAPNATDQGAASEQRDRLLALGDRIRVGLAGNLAAYRFVERGGRIVRGDEVEYDGQPAGYAASPAETINYVDAHDNETLFDAIQMKAPASLPMSERVRMSNLAVGIVLLGQGVPFFHAGADMLRSKSLDRNSYNSGDWFNRLDFSLRTNNWGVGLPPWGDNRAHWAMYGPLLGNPALRATSADITRAAAHFREMLKVRRSSPLFRLRTAEDVQQALRFHATGAQSLPGVIAFSLADEAGRHDPSHALVMVVINARSARVELTVPELLGRPLALHPVLAASDDAVVHHSRFDSPTGGVSIPARTIAVFWSPRERP